MQDKLLSNVEHKLTNQQQCMLDANLSEKESQQAVLDLKVEKSSGIDGFTAEFYKTFWSLIKDRLTLLIVQSKPLSQCDHKRMKVNGFLSENMPLGKVGKIPLRRGVSPLSPLLYVLINKILALQFRKKQPILLVSL